MGGKGIIFGKAANSQPTGWGHRSVPDVASSAQDIEKLGVSRREKERKKEASAKIVGRRKEMDMRARKLKKGMVSSILTL